LPLGIVGIALGTALLPRLSALEAVNDKDQITKTLDEAIIFGGFFVVPAVLALIVLSGPIIEGLFVYGAFGIDDAVMAAMALSAYALGLPGFVMVKVLQPAFYAAGQPGTVLKISIMTVAVNITGSLLLMPLLGHVGLALATSLSGVAAAVVMAILLRRRRRLAGGWIGMTGRIFAASVIMAILLLALLTFASGLRQFLPAAGWLVLLVMVGGGGFLVSAWSLRAIPDEFLRRLRYRKT